MENPVDKALMVVDQRRSWARGVGSLPLEELREGGIDALADEVRRYRALSATSEPFEAELRRAYGEAAAPALSVLHRAVLAAPRMAHQETRLHALQQCADLCRKHAFETKDDTQGFYCRLAHNADATEILKLARPAMDVVALQPADLNELLAAMEEVLRIADRKTDEFDRARAAIAKVRHG